MAERARVVIFHVDDAGLSPDANAGAIAALERGVATSTSVMYPCPAAGAMAQYLRQHPAVDAGIHITLSTESKDDRWSPLAGKERVPSLVDAAGFSAAGCCQRGALGQRGRSGGGDPGPVGTLPGPGVTPTHLDSHCGVVLANPAFFERCVKVGVEAGIPVIHPNHVA